MVVVPITALKAVLAALNLEEQPSVFVWPAFMHLPSSSFPQYIPTDLVAHDVSVRPPTQRVTALLPQSQWVVITRPEYTRPIKSRTILADGPGRGEWNAKICRAGKQHEQNAYFMM